MGIFKKKTKEEKAAIKKAKKLQREKEEHEFYCDMEAGFLDDD